MASTTNCAYTAAHVPPRTAASSLQQSDHGPLGRLGNPGDVRPVGSGVSELRIDYGPGYRVYFVQRGENLIVLLVGGKKDTPARDIAEAIKLASEL